MTMGDLQISPKFFYLSSLPIADKDFSLVIHKRQHDFFPFVFLFYILQFSHKTVLISLECVF